jgi:hypothetical protein
MNIFNKHLLKIVNEYVDHKLPFMNELSKNTTHLYTDFNNWRYYPEHSIKYDNYTIDNEFDIGDWDKPYFRIYCRGKVWRCEYRPNE